MDFAETVEAEWDKHNIQKIEFKRHSNSTQSAGQITSHPAKNFLQGNLFDIFCMLYVDDGAFTFISRQDIGVGSYLVYKKFN